MSTQPKPMNIGRVTARPQSRMGFPQPGETIHHSSYPLTRSKILFENNESSQSSSQQMKNGQNADFVEGNADASKNWRMNMNFNNNTSGTFDVSNNACQNMQKFNEISTAPQPLGNDQTFGRTNETLTRPFERQSTYFANVPTIQLENGKYCAEIPFFEEQLNRLIRKHEMKMSHLHHAERNNNPEMENHNRFSVQSVQDFKKRLCQNEVVGEPMLSDSETVSTASPNNRNIKTKMETSISIQRNPNDQVPCFPASRVPPPPGYNFPHTFPQQRDNYYYNMDNQSMTDSGIESLDSGIIISNSTTSELFTPKENRSEFGNIQTSNGHRVFPNSTPSNYKSKSNRFKSSLKSQKHVPFGPSTQYFGPYPTTQPGHSHSYYSEEAQFRRQFEANTKRNNNLETIFQESLTISNAYTPKKDVPTAPKTSPISVKYAQNKTTTKSLSLSPPARIGYYNSSENKFEYECVFCKGNNEPERIYKSHPIRVNDIVLCPLLRKYVCSLCGATGDNAHTIKYCPLNNRGFFSARSMNFEEAKCEHYHRMAANTFNNLLGRGKQPVVRKLDFDIPSDSSTPLNSNLKPDTNQCHDPLNKPSIFTSIWSPIDC